MYHDLRFLIQVAIIIIFSLPFFKYLLKNEDEKYVNDFNPMKSVYGICFFLTAAYPLCLLYTNGFSFSAAMLLMISIGLGWSCIIDFRLQELPDTITGLFFLVSFGLYCTNSTVDFYQLIAMGLIMLVMLLIWKFTNSLGFGDVKLMVPILLGLPLGMYIPFLTNTMLIAFLYAICLLIFRKVSEDRHFAFGPFMILGFFLTLTGFSIVESTAIFIMNFI